MLILLHRALATAFLTGLGNNLTLAMAFGAGTLVDHLAKHRILRKANIAATVTFGTGFYLGAGLSAIAMAMLTGFVTVKVNFLFNAKGSLFKGNLQVKA